MKRPMQHKRLRKTKNKQLHQDPHTWNKKQISRFFEALLEKCKISDNVYSVIEESEKMGIPYNLVEKWKELDDYYDYLLALCKQKCYCNAEIAALYSRLPGEQGFEYMAENNPEFKERYELDKKRGLF